MLKKYIPEFERSLEAVLRIDPTLKPIVDANTFHAFLAPRPTLQSSFQYLVRNVLSQQVSGAAGQAILGRFLTLCNEGSETEQFPAPETLLKFSVEELRGAGLSVRKAEYVRGLAEAYLNNELSDEFFQTAEDDEVVDKIVSIRGLGPWTAQMFLIFYLFRPDTFSVGDVGVQRGIRRYLKERPHLLKELETPTETQTPPSPGKSKKAQAKGPIPADLKHMERVAARFVPHRTAFQLIMWKLSDIQMNTIEARDAESAKAALQARPKKRKVEPNTPPAETNAKAATKANGSGTKTTTKAGKGRKPAKAEPDSPSELDEKEIPEPELAALDPLPEPKTRAPRKRRK